MRIGLDIDNVVGDFTGHINRCYENWFGEPCPMPDPWPAWDSYKLSPHFQSWAGDLAPWCDKARIWEHMPLIDGAFAGIDRLLGQGHELMFLTARDGDECIDQTKAWFSREIFARFGRKNRLALRSNALCVGLQGNKASVPCSIYVDDSVDELEALKAAGKSTIRFEWPWNKPYKGATASAKDWRMLVEIIGGLE